MCRQDNWGARLKVRAGQHCIFIMLVVHLNKDAQSCMQAVGCAKHVDADIGNMAYDTKHVILSECVASCTVCLHRCWTACFVRHPAQDVVQIDYVTLSELLNYGGMHAHMGRCICGINLLAVRRHCWCGIR